jgi:tetratricopeptide (TPR) repeat protein
MDPAQAGADPLIQDRIQCQGCGRWDDYTLTADAHAELLTESLRLLSNSVSGKRTRGSPIVLISLGLQDGQRMHPEEGLRDYERRLAEHPGDPGLHIGYANILRFLKRIDAAEASYRRALELDPYAAEAHASLAQLAAERGDVPAAVRGFERCVSILPRGHFYRIPEAKRAEFAAATTEDAKRFRELGRVVGELVGEGADAAEASPHREVARPAVGRNAPCPCGSGKKFKKCCLPSQVTEPPAPTPLSVVTRSAVDEELSEYLAEFAARLPRRERDRALALYADVHPPLAGRAEDAHADAVGFMDWFINDYQLRSSGRTIVGEVLASRPHSLTPGAGALLASWRDVPLNLYEVVAVEPGTAITVRELLGSGQHRIRDVRGSNALLAGTSWPHG